MSIHEAKTHLSRLIKLALAGQDVSIANGRSGEMLVKLTPAKPTLQKRQLGLFRDDSPGLDPLAYGFWDPISDVDLALWSGEVDPPENAPAA